jgi:prepilin-type N-terminal cleavage/methylation domain-containing protein
MAYGFTIVEMMIVLAIAGLILMIILQAIPTLQRNARNNQRKQDVNSILAAVSHWELNHSGAIPQQSDDYLPRNLTYYTDPTAITITGILSNDNSGRGPETNVDNLEIFNHQKCNPNGNGTSIRQGAGYNDVVALFMIENGGGGQAPACQEL